MRKIYIISLYKTNNECFIRAQLKSLALGDVKTMTINRPTILTVPLAAVIIYI